MFAATQISMIAYTLRSKIIAHANRVLKRQRRATGLSMSLNSSINKIGGKNENNIASAQLNLNSADLNLENNKQQIVFDTTSAYYDVLRNKNLINVKESSVNLLQKHLDQVISKFQLANAVQSLVTSQNDYDNALATLSNLIGLPVSNNLLIKDIAVVKFNRLPQVNAQISRTMKASAPISKLWTLKKNLPNLKPIISLRFITTTSVKPNLIRLWAFPFISTPFYMTNPFKTENLPTSL